ncbi:MAG: HD family hydrolase [Candidatus Thorarchaeota archaeon]|nr:HD family hydrolase [Candidatus Thorarchaeota archaeon]
MKAKEITNLLLKCNTLKNIERSGWALEGITNIASESVAEHSWGTANIALVLALLEHNQGKSLDISKVLTMAIVHDLPESLISDIPSKAIVREEEDFLEAKQDLEKKAFEEIISSFSEKKIRRRLRKAWQEYVICQTQEAKIVRAADILDMIVQARSFENSGIPPPLLETFFTISQDVLSSLTLDSAMSIFDELLKGHKDLIRTMKQSESISNRED